MVVTPFVFLRILTVVYIFKLSFHSIVHFPSKFLFLFDFFGLSILCEMFSSDAWFYSVVSHSEVGDLKLQLEALRL